MEDKEKASVKNEEKFQLSDEFLRIISNCIANGDYKSLISKKVSVTKNDDSKFDSELVSVKVIKYLSKSREVTKYQFKLLDDTKGNTFFFRIIKKRFSSKPDNEIVIVTKVKYKFLEFIQE